MRVPFGTHPHGLLPLHEVVFEAGVVVALAVIAHAGAAEFSQMGVEVAAHVAKLLVLTVAYTQESMFVGMFS